MRRGKASILELVLWDVILVVLVGALWAIANSLDGSAVALAAPPKVRPNAGGATGKPQTTPNRPPDQPKPPTHPAPGLQTMEAKAKAQLATITEKAKAQEDGGRPQLALDLYEQAPAWLKATAAWKAKVPAEQGRLEGLMRGAHLLACLGPEIRYAADRGKPELVEDFVARIPASHRGRVAGEVDWARSHRPVKKKDRGLEIRGFSPDRVKLEGEHCTVDGTLGRAPTSELLSSLDRVAKRARRVFGRAPAHLRVRILEETDAPVFPDKGEVVLYRRPKETPAAIAPRARYAVARWIVASQASRKSEPWVRAPTARWLAGIDPGALAPPAEGRRRLFLLDPPNGSGDTLLDAVKGGDSLGVRAWALVFFCLSSSDASAAELRLELKAALAGKRLLSGWLTPLKAAGLESAWLTFMRNP